MQIEFEKITNIFMDFDGTLIDSAPGILSTLQFAHAELGLPPPDTQLALKLIGPGISIVFAKLFPDWNEEQRQKAISIYRRRYDQIGYQETYKYPQVEELLQKLKNSKYRVFLTTMKSSSGVERVLGHFKWDHYFAGVYTLECFPNIQQKYQLIEQVLKKEELSLSETVIIGDTLHDVLAGKKNGIASVAVTYGYGELNDLKEAAPDYMCQNAQNIIELLKI